MDSPYQVERLAYQEKLGRFAPFFAALNAVILAAFAFYRFRALSLLGGIAPSLAYGSGLLGYAKGALPSDLLAASFLFASCAALWILRPRLGPWMSGLAFLLATAVSAFMIVATDFLRVYQTAFDKSYVGGEHFTGLSSMLMSATAELSFLSSVALICLAALLAVIILLAFIMDSLPATRPRVDAASGAQGAFRFHAAFSASAILLLIACLSSGWSETYSGRTEKGSVAKEGPSARSLSTNPLSAFVFGAPRATYMPPIDPAPALAHYSTDSLETPEADRPIPQAKKGSLNVILYFFESTSWLYYDLERNGEYVVPNMRRLASKGLLLKNHYSNYPLSANTLYTALSSRYSMYGKAMIFSEYHDVDVMTLPEVLFKQGYGTCFVHSGDLLYAARNKFLANRDIQAFMLEKDLKQDARYGKKVGWGADERAMIDPAVSWIEAQSGPYLLMMSPVSPHHPYAIPDGFEPLADADEPGIGEGERNFRNYLNSLHYADAAMGAFVDKLEARGLMDGTAFVMLTDHGEAFYQHPGNYNHPLFIYEENVHVPALFYAPSAIPAQAPLESVTRHVDIMPSILDLIGVKDSGLRDGESIFSRSREKMAVFHTSWTDELMGVRDGKWKYIKRVKDSREELYDLQSDPGEKANLASAHVDIVRRYGAVADGMVSYMLSQYEGIARK